MKIYLIRHAESEANSAGILAGRMSGVNLSVNGTQQAKRLKAKLASLSIERFYSSPIDRCLITARLALPPNCNIELVEALSEIDFGSWSGEKIESLKAYPLWFAVQSKPSSVTFPDGESFQNAFTRATEWIKNNVSSDGNESILVFTHADIIKLIVTYVIGLDIDRFQSFTIDPASITSLEFVNHEFRLLSLNESLF